MSDLISRSDVVQILKECNLDETLFEKDVFDKINNLPMAYSVDRVVEELEEIKGFACDGKSCSECEYTPYCFNGEQSEKVAIDKAIEIVKQGGVSDDVCKKDNCDGKCTNCNGTELPNISDTKEINIGYSYAYKTDCAGDRYIKAEEVKYLLECERSNAIDDLSNTLKENYDYLPQILSQEAFDGYIDEYAEQLKAGGENDG